MQSRRSIKRSAWAAAALAITAGIVVTISATGAPAAGFPTAASTAAPCAAWTGGGQPPSPGGDNGSNNLWGVAVLSPCNAWAVGYYPSQTIIARWDGASWTQVPSPNPGTDSRLLAVSAVNGTDIWAVGEYFNGTAFQTLTVHFNGAMWTQVPSPSASGATVTALSAVSAVSTNDVWAVGHFQNSGNFDQTYILHWDGTSWTHVPSPHPGGTTRDQDLDSVSGDSAKDAWATGSYYNGSADQSLALHWDGTSWKQVTSPNPGPEGNRLFGVRAISASNAWAVGSSSDATTEHTLIAHWNGTSWKQVAAPNPGGVNGTTLRSVAVISANDAWAVGDYGTGTGVRTLALHWNGSAWQQANTPNISAGSTIDDSFAAIGAGPPGAVWAVGNYFDGLQNQTLAFHCC